MPQQYHSRFQHKTAMRQASAVTVANPIGVACRKGVWGATKRSSTVNVARLVRAVYLRGLCSGQPNLCWETIGIVWTSYTWPRCCWSIETGKPGAHSCSTTSSLTCSLSAIHSASGHELSPRSPDLSPMADMCTQVVPAMLHNAQGSGFRLRALQGRRQGSVFCPFSLLKGSNRISLKKESGINKSGIRG